MEPHPIRLIVTDDLRRHRLTVLFRLLLAIPHFVWLWLWSIAAAVATIIAWFAALFTKRVPLGLHDFLAHGGGIVTDPLDPCGGELPRSS